MLSHQNWTTEAVAATNVVTLTSRTVSNFIVDETCHSGIRLGSDGVLRLFQNNGGLSAVVGQWLVNGTASTFYAQRTITVGTLEVDAGAGFLQLNVNRDYDNQKSTTGVKTTTVFFEISSDASGTPIVDTATMTFISERESGL